MTERARNDGSSISLIEAMSTARAIRRFRPDPLPDALIEAVVRAASYAPSGGNLQQWRVVVVTDGAQRSALGPIWRSSWERYLESFPTPEPAKAQDFANRQLAASSALAESIEAVPAIAIFCHYPGLIAYTDEALERPSVVGGASLYPAVQNFLLACRAHGLGAVLTTTICLAEREVAELLGIPETVGVHAAVPFGYPDGVSHGTLRRRPVHKLAYRDSWGVEWTPGS